MKIHPVDAPSMSIFVAGTDTGVGKTEAAAALLSLLAERGLRPAPFKPYESGCRRLSAPADALCLRRAAGSRDALELVCPHRYRAPVAPGVAARRLGLVPSLDATLAAYGAFRGRPVVAEGSGGLRVPIDRHRDVIDLIALLELEVLLVARAQLGTLNHTALSLDLLASREIPVRAVLLVESRPERDASMRDNARYIEERHGLAVLGPVPYEVDAGARRQAFRRALSPLVATRRTGNRELRPDNAPLTLMSATS